MGRALVRPCAVIKSAVLASFEELGGTEYLVQIGRDDPKTYCALLAKVLPSEIRADVGVDEEALLRALTEGRKRAIGRE